MKTYSISKWLVIILMIFITGKAPVYAHVLPLQGDTLVRAAVKLNNVVLTPHTAAYSPESLDMVKTMVIDEIIRIIKGEKPLNQVNP